MFKNVCWRAEQLSQSRFCHANMMTRVPSVSSTHVKKMAMVADAHKPNTGELDLGGPLGWLVSQASQLESSRLMKDPITKFKVRRTLIPWLRMSTGMPMSTYMHTHVRAHLHTPVPHTNIYTYPHMHAQRHLFASDMPSCQATCLSMPPFTLQAICKHLL